MNVDITIAIVLIIVIIIVIIVVVVSSNTPTLTTSTVTPASSNSTSSNWNYFKVNNSDRYLNVSNRSYDNSRPLIQYDCNNNEGQLFMYDPSSQTLKIKISGKCVDVTDSNTNNGVGIYNNTIVMEFKLNDGYLIAECLKC